MSTFYLRLLVQVIVAVLIFAWLSLDFYNTFFHGSTLPLRMSGEILFRDNPVVFIFVVAIKMAVFGFFAHLIYDCYKKFKNRKIKEDA